VKKKDTRVEELFTNQEVPRHHDNYPHERREDNATNFQPRRPRDTQYIEMEHRRNDQKRQQFPAARSLRGTLRSRAVSGQVLKVGVWGGRCGLCLVERVLISGSFAKCRPSRHPAPLCHLEEAVAKRRPSRKAAKRGWALRMTFCKTS